MKEKDSIYYNKVYSREGSPYLGAPKDLEVYYEVWLRAAKIICSYKNIEGAIKIIDIGCGPGHFPKVLDQEGFFKKKSKNLYFGYDFSSKAISMARNLNDSSGATFFERDVVANENAFYEALDDDGGKIVYCSFEFLEHVESDLLVLSRLEKGSKILASVPSFDSAGHVRFFKNLEEVSHRYSTFISFDDIKEHEYISKIYDTKTRQRVKHKLYLMVGTVI